MRKEINIKILYYILGFCLISVLFLNMFFVLKNDKPTKQEVFKSTIYSIVEVKAVTENVGESYGTAEFIKSDGTLVTNAHVVTYKKLGETVAFDEIFISNNMSICNECSIAFYKLCSSVTFPHIFCYSFNFNNAINCAFKNFMFCWFIIF